MWQFYLKFPSAKMESSSFRFWKKIGKLFFKCFIFLSQNIMVNQYYSFT